MLHQTHKRRKTTLLPLIFTFGSAKFALLFRWRMSDVQVFTHVAEVGADVEIGRIPHPF